MCVSFQLFRASFIDQCPQDDLLFIYSSPVMDIKMDGLIFCFILNCVKFYVL